MRIQSLIGGFCVFVFLLTAGALAQQRLCCFGDSIAEGWIDAERNPSAAWPALLDSMLRTQGRQVMLSRVAHGGETTGDALRRVEHEVLPLAPDCCILAFGSNDMFIWGDPPAVRVPLQQFREQLRLVVRKLQGSGCRVLLLGMPPMLEHRFYHYADSAYFAPYGGARQLQQKYEQVMMDVAAAEQAGYVSLNDAFMNPETLLGFDGVHPSKEGHRSIASALLTDTGHQLDADARTFADAALSVFPSPYMRKSEAYLTLQVRAAAGMRVCFTILDLAGRMRRKIVYFTQSDGVHFYRWDSRGDDGTLLPPGAYIVHVRISGRSYLKSILLY